jgi:hypothetical protein
MQYRNSFRHRAVCGCSIFNAVFGNTKTGLGSKFLSHSLLLFLSSYIYEFMNRTSIRKEVVVTYFEAIFMFSLGDTSKKHERH